MGISRSVDLFEPSLLHEAHAWSRIRTFRDQVLDVLALVDDLGLNTRIWTKR